MSTLTSPQLDAARAACASAEGSTKGAAYLVVEGPGVTKPPTKWNMSPVAMLVERSTRFLMLVALPGGNRQADAVADALSAAITTLPSQLAKSLTWELVHEMAQHQRFSINTGVQVYFCDPSLPGSAAATRTPIGAGSAVPGWCRISRAGLL